MTPRNADGRFRKATIPELMKAHVERVNTLALRRRPFRLPPLWAWFVALAVAILAAFVWLG